MREILFRGKRKDNGDWVYGDLRHYFECVEIDDGAFYPRWHTVIPETVGQYTGLDANGTKIFEGDIIRRTCSGENYEYFYDYVVVFNELLGEFELVFIKSGGCLAMFHAKEGEVIGNIHDNPELLKGK